MFRKTMEEYEADTRKKLVIDIREKEAFDKETMPGALHMDSETLKQQIKELTKDQTPVYLLCHTGQQSDALAEDFEKEGYEVYSIQDGFRAYLRLKLRTVMRQEDLKEQCCADVERSIVKKFRKEKAQRLRSGFLGHVSVAIIEACEITEDGRIYLTAGVGITPTIARLADKVIVELNAAHSKSLIGMHDLYEMERPPYRRPIPIVRPSDRIGLPYIQVDPSKIAGVVETNMPDEARGFHESDPVTDKIGQNVAEFLASDMRRGIIPSTFLPLQSGVGNIANAVLSALGKDPSIPPFEMYTEVIQNSVIKLVKEGRIKFGSTCSLSVTNDCLQDIYDNMDFFRHKLVLRPSEISNCPEVVRRIGVISMNTAIEADIYGNVNSTHICGTKMMNGIGGSGDFTRSAYISIFSCPSTAKGGCISSIVPMVSHLDHSEHSVNVIITEQGIADLRGKSPMERAEAVIENCAHPDYKQLLWDYLKISTKGQTCHSLSAALGMHQVFINKGDMRLTDWAEFQK